MSGGSNIEPCCDAKVKMLLLSWGDPQPFVADAHERSMFIVSQYGNATDVGDAADALSAGASALSPPPKRPRSTTTSDAS